MLNSLIREMASLLTETMRNRRKVTDTAGRYPPIDRPRWIAFSSARQQSRRAAYVQRSNRHFAQIL